MSEGPRLCVTPAGALEDVIAGHMSDTDYRVLAALGTFTDRRGWTFPMRQERLAERCGFKRGQANRSLRRLEWLGWVQVKRAERTDKPSAYRVRLDPDDLRAPGAAPSVSFEAWKQECAALASKRAGKLSEADLKVLEGLSDDDGEGCGADDGPDAGPDAGEGYERAPDQGGTPMEAGDQPPPVRDCVQGGLVRDCVQGALCAAAYTPCTHCAHSSYDSLSRIYSPLPPFPDADPVGGLEQEGGGAATGEPATAAQAETAYCSAEGRQAQGLSPDDWRSIRAALKRAAGERAYAAHVARLRLVAGRVVATSPHEAREAASAIGPALRRAGIPSIHTEAGEAISL